MSCTLAPRSQSVHVSLSRRGLLRRRPSSGRTAAEAAVQVPGSGSRRSSRDTDSRRPYRMRIETTGARVIRKLIKDLIDAFEERTGLLKMMADMAEHPVPPDTGWWYVFGSATLVAFVIQVVTGIALSTAYISSAGDAYQAL